MAELNDVSEWLSQWREIRSCSSSAVSSTDHDQLTSYGQTLLMDESIICDILAVIEQSQPHELLELVCSQLLEYYQTEQLALVCFCWQFVPALAAVHLNSVATETRQALLPVETLLLSIYNLEVVEAGGADSKPRVVSFRMPTLIKQSVYHEPLHITPSSLTEHSMSRVRLGDNFTVDWGPFPQVKHLDSRCRQRVLTALFSLYSGYMSFLSEPGLQSACQAVKRICTQGFVPMSSDEKLCRRLVVSSSLLVEFVHILHFLCTESLQVSCSAQRRPVSAEAGVEVERCCGSYVQLVARHTLAALRQRARYHTYHEALAAAEALLHSLLTTGAAEQQQQHSPSVSKSDDWSPRSRTSTIITNASFRTKKLPDDIPIRRSPRPAGQSNQQLVSIDEQSTAAANSGAEAAPSDPTDSTTVKQRPRGRQLSAPSRDGAAVDRHVTAMLSALPNLKRRSTGATSSSGGGGGDHRRRQADNSGGPAAAAVELRTATSGGGGGATALWSRDSGGVAPSASHDRSSTSSIIRSTDV